MDNIRFFHYKNGLVDKSLFKSSNNELQRYVQNTMSQNEAVSASRNYIGLNEKDQFVSMFSLSASTIKRNTTKDIKDLPKYEELPTVKIGRLVVHDDHQRKGIGQQTLGKAISVFVDIYKILGAIGLAVDAKEDAVGFYEKYGFVKLEFDRKNKTTYMMLYSSLLKKNRPSLFEEQA